MNKLVRNLEDALNGIETLNSILPKSPELADRLGFAHAFYILEEKGDPPLFGFSKFIGYKNLDADAYLNNYKKLDGRNTEHALDEWFEELRYDSPAYRDMFAELKDWMATFDKKPRGGERQKVRLMVVRPEFREEEASVEENRHLLNLMIAVADMLPATQRLELRASL